MHAIGNALLKAGVGCVVNQTAKAVLESPDKNRNDFRQLNASIDSFKRGITDVKSQLDGIARKDLLASISFFNEGFVYLCQVFNEASSVTGMNARLPTMAEASTPGSQTPSAAWLEAISLIKALILDLDDSAIRMLSDAKERFKDARRKATKAFCNEALSTSERIFAMRCRVAATLLEKVDNPVEALIACKLCLEELNSMPAVKGNFGGKRSNTGNPLVKEVCDVNSVICDITQQFGHGVGELLNWPCVTVRNGAKIDPLHNAGTQHCCLTWSFGQEGEEEHQLKFAWGITSNTRGDFIVADSVDRNVKVFNGSGRFLYSLYPFAEDLQSKDDYEVWNVASDGNDDLYVLTLRRNDFPMANLSEVRVFNKDGHPKHKFALRDGFRGSSIAVDDNNRVFVTGGAFSGCHNDVIEVYNNGGVFMHSFGNEHLKNAQDVTIANTDRLVVLNGEKDPLVLLFSNEGQLLKKFAVQGSTADDSGVAVTFHKASKTVLVASLQSETGIEVSMYSENGQFVRRIQFKTKGCRFITGITTTAKGRIAVPSQNVVFFG